MEQLEKIDMGLKNLVAIASNILMFGFCLFSIFLFIRTDISGNFPLYTLLNYGAIEVNFGFDLNPLSKIMILVISLVSFCVNLYSCFYMKKDHRFSQFIVYLIIFTLGMTILVVASNIIQVFFGWEIVGIMSYLIVSFWHEKHSAREMGYKVLIINKIGDTFLLIAIMFSAVKYENIAIFEQFYNFNFAIQLCVIIGCVAKSAQIFFHIWLPCAMEGPTPASALMHAATMVTAGVFLLAKIDVQQFDLIFHIGILTSILTGALAIFEQDIKKIIAYSTCSQIGYMFIAVGLGFSNYAIFHLLTHAFFKSALFLCAANLIYLTKKQNIFEINLPFVSVPITMCCMAIAVLSMTGAPFFAGYFSKELIISAAKQESIYMYYVMLAGVFMTSVYSYRMLFALLGFEASQPQLTSEALSRAPHLELATDGLAKNQESGFLMTVPLIMLCFLSILSGVLSYFGIFKFYLGDLSSHFDILVFITNFFGFIAILLQRKLLIYFRLIIKILTNLVKIFANYDKIITAFTSKIYLFFANLVFYVEQLALFAMLEFPAKIFGFIASSSKKYNSSTLDVYLNRIFIFLFVAIVIYFQILVDLY